MSSFSKPVSMPIPSLPMASTVVDSILFRDAFGTRKMREIFSDGALIQRYIDVVELARGGRELLRHKITC